MKKIKSIANILVIIGILLHLTSFAAKGGMNGFADMQFVLSDGADENVSAEESKFFTTAEFDFTTKLDNQLSVRLDLDLNASGQGQGDSGRLEQAYFTWVSRGGVQLQGGIFNNHLGWEAEDAPQLYQITHGQVFEIWDDQTDLPGNNVEGIAVSGKVGQAKVMGAFLNDLGGANEENSTAIVVNFYPKKGLAAEVGMITQDTGAETIIDGSLTYRKGKYLLGAEYMQCNEIYESAYSITLNYIFNGKMNGTVRYDTVNYENENIEPTSSLTFAIANQLHKNLYIKGEFRQYTDENNQNNDGNIIRAELVATF